MQATQGQTFYSSTPSPIGELLLTGDGESITGVLMEMARWGHPSLAAMRHDDGPFAAARKQLAAYFAGELRAFDLPLSPVGTEFQRGVWMALRAIPYGETTSYAAIARGVGNPKGVRAVGLANGRNPISIIVPCHRVVGSDGSLTGYGGGIERKKWLLEHETRFGGVALLGQR